MNIKYLLVPFLTLTLGLLVPTAAFAKGHGHDGGQGRGHAPGWANKGKGNPHNRDVKEHHDHDDYDDGDDDHKKHKGKHKGGINCYNCVISGGRGGVPRAVPGGRTNQPPRVRAPVPQPPRRIGVPVPPRVSIPVPMPPRIAVPVPQPPRVSIPVPPQVRVPIAAPQNPVDALIDQAAGEAKQKAHEIAQ